MNPTDRPIEILLVEDSPGDVRLTREAFKEGKIRNRLHVVADGKEALDFLCHRGSYEEAVQPDLILLDLNLPKVDGREVLKIIKEDETLRRIPVVVLTTSDTQRDIEASYDLHANCFITKPVGIDDFLEIIQQIEDFWVCVVTLPSDVKSDSVA